MKLDAIKCIATSNGYINLNNTSEWCCNTTTKIIAFLFDAFRNFFSLETETCHLKNFLDEVKKVEDWVQRSYVNYN